MIAPTLPKCGNCYMIVCEHHKRIIDQCRCIKAMQPEERQYVPCPGCWGNHATTVGVRDAGR